jgi:hypothetical protein
MAPVKGVGELSDKAKLARTLEWYARDTDSESLRNVLNDAADALEDAAQRDAADDEIERMIGESYR